MRKFENYNTLELLDDTLIFISITDNEMGIKAIELLESLRNSKYSELKLTQLYIILEKLEKDKYITQGVKEYRTEVTTIKGTYYEISIDGIVFLEMGGYRGQKKESQNQKDLISNTFLLTLIVAWGTLIAAIYYIFQLYCFGGKSVAISILIISLLVLLVWGMKKYSK
jgi:hypothetical protein